MAKAILDNNNIATAAGDITVFNFDGGTREYLSSSVEYLAVGVGVPAHSCPDAPGDGKEGYVICRTADLTAWEYAADHRGETVWSTSTRKPMMISMPGDYPEGVTPLAPATSYDKWNGSEWVTDTSAQHAAEVDAAEQQKTALLAEASAVIVPLSDAAAGGYIDDADKPKLAAWQRYRYGLTKVDTSTAPAISWPVKPAA
ncbi:tail fiber assembly protein [Pluralibacter sp.]|uniref:tail fiber assembly protein n=1 Tax=Pluralibacter sp. TaxID=1920032 RepID=UPI0025D2A42E|nr:tail fiber assembly protein [Pluralibacter sp.]MBV8044485.1 tail fiber assembly protein [Pluralibacter sp.]